MADPAPASSGISVAPESGPTLTSRPLKTGKSFLLVVRAPLVQHLGWDAAGYSAGDTCKLAISGKNLGKDPVEVSIEVERDGGWVEIEKVKAQVDSDESKATVEWKVPAVEGHGEAAAAQKGEVVRAIWANPDVAEGEALTAQAEGERLEGKTLLLMVEREFPDGTWRCVFHDERQVRDGKCELTWTPPVEGAGPDGTRPPPPGSLVGCSFEDGRDLGAADVGWLKVNCAGLEQQAVQIVLERDDGGDWSEVSSAVSTVKSGE